MPFCDGCKVNFPNNDSLSRHERQCGSIKLKRALALQDYQAQLRSETEVDVQASFTQDTPSVVPMHEDSEQDTEQGKVDDELDSQIVNRPALELPTYDGTKQRDIPMELYQDEAPPLPSVIPENVPLDNNNENQAYVTKPNHFGLYRRYPSGKPTYTPDVLFGDEHVSDAPGFLQTMSRTEGAWWDQVGSSLEIVSGQKNPPVNKSVHLLLEWYWDPTSTTKTFTDGDKLVKNVIQHPDFSVEDFTKFRGMARETEKLDEFINSPESLLPTSDKWIQSSVKLPVPCPGYDFVTKQINPPMYTVDGLYHRKLLDVLKAALNEPTAQFWHFSGFEEYHRSTDGGPDQRVYSEIYNTDAYLDAEKRVKEKAAKAGSKLEACVLAMQLWSDSTHLADFGTASLWPVYLYPGNLTKYIRTRPTTFSANHLAYIPKLGDGIHDFYMKSFQRSPQPEMLAYLRKELYQLIWHKLLDDEFVDAYNNGFEWECIDGVTRLFFPRLITYSGDYPERATLGCIKNLGKHPCPLCLVPKKKIRELGTAADFNNHEKHYRFDHHPLWYDIKSARKRLFKGESITSRWFKETFDRQSITASRSAFSEKLEHDEYFQVFQMLAPDLLHEIEIGSWKAVFTHLVRMLTSMGDTAVSRLNARYRHVPPFGRDTIRAFSNNAAEMKRLGARDMEDALQCGIPTFRNLFRTQKDSDQVRTLIFDFATWHALAKLRRHTDATVADLRSATTRLGQQLRAFADKLAPKYATKELKNEKERRLRAHIRKGTKTANETSGTSKIRSFKLDTFKIHAMGHYAAAISQIGTTDNYSTQIGESQHRHVKRWYTRVRKGNTTFVAGIARQQRREKALFQLRAKASKGKGEVRTSIDTGKQLFLPFEYSEKLEKAPLYLHHQISKAQRKENRIVLPSFLEANKGDPALKDFLPRLKTHLLLRLQRQEFQGDEENFTAAELNAVVIENDMIYNHKGARFNYTSYDGRREQDSVGTRKNADIMMLAHEDDPSGHAFWYARIVAVFHCRVIHNTPSAALGVRVREMEFLWVRWLGIQEDHEYGWKAKDLPKVGFINERTDNSMAFGFVDPAEVIRAVHLIPSFSEGKSNNGMPKTIARPPTDNDLDWNYFFVNFFVDRDMFMRYRGGGIGHASTAAVTSRFLKDRDPLDMAAVDEEMSAGEEDTEMESDGDESDSPSDAESEGAMEEDSDSDNESELLNEALDFDYDWDDVEITGEGDEEVNLENLGPEDGENDEDELGHDVVGFAGL